MLIDTYISEKIFENCTVSEGSIEGSEFQSCYFLNTIFQDLMFFFTTLFDSKFSNSKKSIEFETEVFFDGIFDQINKFRID